MCAFPPATWVLRSPSGNGPDDLTLRRNGFNLEIFDNLTSTVVAQDALASTNQVIITGGGTDVLPWAVGSLRDGGTVHYFAGGGDALSLRLETLYHRELTLTATYSSSPSDLAEAFRLIVAGEVSVDGLVTHRVSLGDLDRGVDLMRRREALKVYVTP